MDDASLAIFAVRAAEATFAVAAVGPFARIEDELSEIEPPGRQTEAFERLQRFFIGEGCLERALCLFPVASRERGIAGVGITRRVRGHETPTIGACRGSGLRWGRRFQWLITSRRAWG